MRTFGILGLVAAGIMLTRPQTTLSVGTPAASQRGDFTWHGVVAKGKTLEIRGVNGAIDATPASGSEVEITARKTAKRSDPDDVKIVVVPHDGNVTICAVYPTPAGDRENTCEPGGGRNNTRNNDVTVDFTVHVPAGVVFSGHTVNGDVNATGLTGDAEISTVNGSADLETSGTGRANTVNGSVHVTMGASDWTGDLRCSTVNGGITVSLPAGLNADLSAETVNGDIISDFPVTIQGRFGPRRMHGVVGSGGRKLILKTVNGSIELRKT